MLIVTSVYFLSNDTTPVLTSTSPAQTSMNDNNTKNNVILFIAIGSVGGLSLFLCICSIIISICIYQKCKSKRKYNLKRRFVAYVMSINVDVIIYRGREVHRKKDDSEDHYYSATERNLNNKQYLVHDKIGISSNR